jgi:FixJ family two-component response regulator
MLTGASSGSMSTTLLKAGALDYLAKQQLRSGVTRAGR